MALLCKLFGHTAESGYSGDAPYLDLVPYAVDGVGRRHAYFQTTCQRCGERYILCYTHIPRDIETKFD